MRSLAGTICGFITVIIYGAALIAGIAYHNMYVSAYEYAEGGVEFGSDYFLVWLGIILMAAVLSATHHALWSIINNQLEIHEELRVQKSLLIEMYGAQQGNHNSSNHTDSQKQGGVSKGEMDFSTLKKICRDTENGEKDIENEQKDGVSKVDDTLAFKNSSKV